MEHKTFLFFDCECANCFDGIGKICSLGYVLADDELNVIESSIINLRKIYLMPDYIKKYQF